MNWIEQGWQWSRNQKGINSQWNFENDEKWIWSWKNLLLLHDQAWSLYLCCIKCYRQLRLHKIMWTDQYKFVSYGEKKTKEQNCNCYHGNKSINYGNITMAIMGEKIHECVSVEITCYYMHGIVLKYGNIKWEL